ncbi:MAG TPA: DUF3105 domain-containing protein [Acidimicrobiales bacterium]|nr:DUF3105 domain-containing protein [Acidimicrobiales bacterium]
MRKVALVAVVVLAVLVVVGMLAGDRDGGDGDEAAEVVALGVTPEEAGCGPVEHERPVPPGPPHRNGTLEWPEVPPNSGVHHAQTLRTLTRFYEREDDPPPERVVHNLEHGIVVVWYDDRLPDEELAVLRQVADAMPINRFVVVPWNRSTFDGDRHVVLTAWGHTQRCERVSGRVIHEFTREYADKDAPEDGAPV